MPVDFPFELFDAFILPGDNRRFEELTPQELVISSAIHKGRVSTTHITFFHTFIILTKWAYYFILSGSSCLQSIIKQRHCNNGQRKGIGSQSRTLRKWNSNPEVRFEKRVGSTCRHHAQVLRANAPAKDVEMAMFRTGRTKAEALEKSGRTEGKEWGIKEGRDSPRRSTSGYAYSNEKSG